MLNGQNILITGANGGIGIAIAERLLQNNANLILLYNKNNSKINDLVARYPDYSSKIEIHKVDLVDESSVNEVLSKIISKKNIDVFIHAVTIPLIYKGILKLKWSDFQSHLELQTKSFFQIVQKIVPQMKEKKKGKIIPILTSAVIGNPPSNLSHYTVGKYSLLGMVKSLAVELNPLGINVNSISPSMTMTPLVENFPSKLKEIAANESPLGRLLTPEDITPTVLFLCSKNSDDMSGENLLINGSKTIYQKL